LTAEDLVAAYTTSLGRAAQTRSYAGAARSWWAAFGGPEGFLRAGLDAQLAIPKDACRFVDWLVVTRRLAPSADYLVARRAHLGRLFARAYPAQLAAFGAASDGLGFTPGMRARQWVVLAQICAVTGRAPDELTHDQLVAGREALVEAAGRHWSPPGRHRISAAAFALEATLFHAGVTDRITTRRSPRARSREEKWSGIPASLAATAFGYLDQMALSMRPATIDRYEIYLRQLARFLASCSPPVERIGDVGRAQIEAYKKTLLDPERQLTRASMRDHLAVLRTFFERLVEWGDPEAPARVPIFAGDLPVKDRPLPRFLDDASSARLLQAARSHPDRFVRVCVELLARTGLRKSELLGLRTDAVVQIGSSHWLRVPLGKLHNDRFIPLHPQLKALLDEWLAHRGNGLRSDLVFVEKGRPISKARVDAAVDAAARAAGLGNVTPHRLRHTLATQAINRGMSLEAIAALLGHTSLTMTLTYARIADRTVADEYFSVAAKVEALYGEDKALPADAEGAKMVKLRREMSRRMLGNGYCTRPPELDCQFESICESCTFFATTIEFRPTLERQRDDAAAKGQSGRQELFDGLLARLDSEAS
jgi:integrase